MSHSLVLSRTRPLVPIALGVIIFATLAALYVEAPTFFRLNNLINLLVQTSILGVLAVGLTFVLVGGGIDLSMPATMALAAVLGATAMVATQSALIGVPIMLIVGCGIGVFNGLAITRLGMAPFVATLATLTVAGGLTVWLTASQSVSGYPYLFDDLFLTRILGLPVSVWLFFAIIGVATQALDGAAFGRKLRAVGFNQRAAEVARIDVRRTLLATYVIAGLAAGMTAIMLTARLGSASASMASDSLLLDIISACVIGRVSIYGGVGSPLMAAIGALVVTIITNAMNQFGVSYFASLVIKGVIILVLVYLDNLARKGK
jgi:ribose transport system permease protein